MPGNELLRLLDGGVGGIDVLEVKFADGGGDQVEHCLPVFFEGAGGVDWGDGHVGGHGGVGVLTVHQGTLEKVGLYAVGD